MKAIWAAVTIGWIPVGAAVGQAQSDAERIVEVTMSDELFEAVADSMAFSIVASLQNEVAKSGERLSDQAASNLAGMMIEEMLPRLRDGLRERGATVYEDLLSADTLSAYRQFLETPEGRELADQTPLIMQESQKLGEQIGVEIIPQVLANLERRVEAEDWPEGTLPSSKKEIRTFLLEE